MVAKPESLPTFEYTTAALGDLRFGTGSKSASGKYKVDTLSLDGRELRPSSRFWRSFFTRFGLNDSVFRYFEPNEVFERVAERNEDEVLRICIESRGNDEVLLGATALDRPVLGYASALDLVTDAGAVGLEYRDGLLTSTHHPRARGREFAIGADQFQDRFVLETPIDGFGSPRLFLSLVRLVCSNGAVGYTRAFRSDIPSGKDLDHCIRRALASFDSAEGYVALRQRFESAQKSFASVGECMSLEKVIQRVDETDGSRKQLSASLRELSGNLVELYGLTNLEALSEKRRRVLPARCRVYDLLNFASEVATHHANPAAAWALQAWIGSRIGDEYDLEGTAAGSADFDAFFLNN